MPFLGLKGLSRFWRRNPAVVFCFFFLAAIFLLVHTNKDWSGNSSWKQEMDDPVLERQRHGLDDSMIQLQKDYARVEAELKYERLKAEMLNRDLIEARKVPESPVTQLDLMSEEDQFKHEQKTRKLHITRVCAEQGRLPGLVNTLISNMQGLTYCITPRFVNLFWIQVYRYINRDYFGEAIKSPLHISKKEAYDRPFIRTKKIGWNRLTSDQRTALLDTEILLTVQDPYRRLWETYVETLMLPQKWSTVGLKIAKKRSKKDLPVIRKPNELFLQTCGHDVSFEEFVQYAMVTYETDYDPIYRQCDPCQLKPTYIIKRESLMKDTEAVLKRINLGWVVQSPNFTDDTNLRLINTTVSENFEKFQEARKQNCASPEELGQRFYAVFKNMGIIPDGVSAPKIDVGTTEADIIHRVTRLYFIATDRRIDREAQKRKLMLDDYKKLGQVPLSDIRNKYAMDFKLFGYSEMIQDLS